MSEALSVAALHAIFGDDVRVLEDPQPLAGGTMHPSWSVDIERDGAPLPLVVRTTPPGRTAREVAWQEYGAINASLAQGVPAPAVHGVGELESGDTYVIMTRMHGDANPRPLLRDPRFEHARKAIVPQLADALARVHRVPLSDVHVELDGPAPGQDPILKQCEVLEAKYLEDRLERHPVVEWGLRWVALRVEAHASSPAPTLVHGDFRIGNVLYDESGLTTVLDWEGVHFSEPLEDLGWFCVRAWRFGLNTNEAGGVASRDAWVSAYEAASGAAVDRGRLALWEILMNIRWDIIILNQVKTHVTGIVRSQELAAIGRRTAETELEILRLARMYMEDGHAG